MVTAVEVPVGEHPDVVIARAVSEIDELNAENRQLKERVQELEAANAVLQTQRDTANALANRRGW